MLICTVFIREEREREREREREKMVYHINEKSLPTPKPVLYPQKFLMYVRRNMTGTPHYELLE